MVLDTDVFSRIFGADSREDSEALVLAPASPLMRDGISLVQTRALAVELNETGDPGLRRRLLGSLSALEVLRGELASVAAAQAELLDRVPNNVLDADPTLIRDAHNIAFAKVGGATCFVTMDRSALRHLAPLALELWNFPVRRPVQALIDEFADQDNSRYLPMGLASTDFGIRELTGDSALSGFVAHASGERERAWEGSFAAALASSMTTGGLRKLVLDPTGDPVAVLITDSQHSRVIVQVFRVSSRHQLALSIARQLASLLRIEAVAIGADRIEVTDRHAGPIVQDGLLQEGFKRSELGLYFCDVTDDVVSVGDPRIPSSGGANPPDFAALEHDAWPVKIRGGGIPSIVIPIRPAFADALLGRETLVARRPLIGLSRENVYYRAPTRSVPSPSRVLWYASRPVSAVVACSRVIHVESGPVDLIHSTRAHLGVWKRRDIELAAKDGQVQAVHFTDTESLFPVNFERLAPLAPSDSLGTIRTVTSISEEGFLSIYQAGRGRR